MKDSIPFTASGYVYHDGTRTSNEFADFFGFEAGKFPHYFTINRNDLVVCRPMFRQACEERYAAVRRNFATLGIST